MKVGLAAERPKDEERLRVPTGDMIGLLPAMETLGEVLKRIPMTSGPSASRWFVSFVVVFCPPPPSSSSSSSSSGHSPDEEAPPSPLPDFLDEDPFAPPPPPVASPETSYYDEMDNFASYYAPPPPPKPSVALPSQILARSTMKSGGDSRSRTPSLVELTNARLPRRMVSFAS